MVSTSEVDGLDDSGTMLLYVHMQKILLIIIFVESIINVFLLQSSFKFILLPLSL